MSSPSISGDEMWQGVQSRLDLAPIVFCCPIARECLDRRELYALRLIGDGFSFRPSRRIDAPAQIGKLRFRDIDMKGTNRIPRCLLAAPLCSTGFAHGALLLGNSDCSGYKDWGCFT